MLARVTRPDGLPPFAFLFVGERRGYSERSPAALELMANLLQLLRNLAHVPDTAIEEVIKTNGSRNPSAGLQVRVRSGRKSGSRIESYQSPAAAL